MSSSASGVAPVCSESVPRGCGGRALPRADAVPRGGGAPALLLPPHVVGRVLVLGRAHRQLVPRGLSDRVLVHLHHHALQVRWGDTHVRGSRLYAFTDLMLMRDITSSCHFGVQEKKCGCFCTALIGLRLPSHGERGQSVPETRNVPSRKGSTAMLPCSS